MPLDLNLTNYDERLLLPVSEVVHLFKSVAEEHRQKDAIAVLLSVNFLKVVG